VVCESLGLVCWLMLVGLPALLEAEALAVHLQDMDMVGEAVEEGPGELQFSGGIVYRKGSGTGEPVLDLGQVLELANPLSQYNQGEMGLEATYYFRSSQECYPCGAHAVHLAVDPETGQMALLKYAIAEDVGHVINPLLLMG